MKLIRWWGLLVFAGLVLLLGLAFYLLAPKLIADSIESFGSETLGAKVEVAKVELSLFPAAVTINRLVATDPKKPMQNIFDSEQIKLSIDSKALLWKKLLIEEMVLTGVKTATPRKTSGALAGGRKSSQIAQKVVEMIVPNVSKDNIAKLVDKADLITIQRKKDFENKRKQLKQQWSRDLDKNEFDNRIDSIEAEYKRLSERVKEKKLNLLLDRKDWKKLKESIDFERDNIKRLSKKLQQDKKLLTKKLKQVKKGPNDDLNKIMQRFGLGNGLEGLVDKYIGPQYTPWVIKGLELIKQFKSSKDDGSENASESVAIALGKKVYFENRKNFPEFLIKKIKLSGSDTNWNLDGDGFNLGYLPWLIGQPAKLNLQLGGQSQAKLDIASDWQSSNKMLTQLNSSLTNWPVTQMKLMETKEGAWLINSGSLAINLKGNVSLDNIDLVASFNIKKPQLAVPDGLPDWQQLLAKNISNEQQIDFKLTAQGSILSPKIKVDSSLEKLFKKVINEKFKQKAEKLKQQAKQKLIDKVGDLSGLENFNGDFKQWQSKLLNKDKLLKEILGKIKL